MRNDLGPFEVLAKVGPVAFKLRLPPIKIHPTFHVSLLDKYRTNVLELRVEDPSAPPVVFYDALEFEVQSIFDSRVFKSKLRHWVHWKGFPAGDRQWI